MNRSILPLLVGLVLGVVLTLTGGYLFLTSGGLPVSTKQPALPFEVHIAKKALHHAVKDEESKTSPLLADEMNLLAGAKVYRTHCAVCHSLPDHSGTFISMGMQPEPPWFFEAGANQGVEKDSIGEIFWFVKNGIRMTGMPGFQDNLTENEIWQVSLLLKTGRDLPETVKKALAAP